MLKLTYYYPKCILLLDDSRHCYAAVNRLKGYSDPEVARRRQTWRHHQEYY